ncbi:MAG TPA: ribbon-helix-helix protein, CopG family [Candidatus Thermoplasmatota archaeon]|nr:ribbon-helix-helix protein, CopG family [Candidatus Thermoplasmatota archaeon]
MSKTTEVKVRLGDEEEKLLRRLVDEEGVNRSEVVRRSLRAYDARRREDAALDQLVAWAEVDEARLKGGKPKKVRFRME